MIGAEEQDKNKPDAQTTYVTYLKQKIIPELGTYDADNPQHNAEGVYSALFCDLNNDDNDEFIVAYSKKDGSKVDFNISCYGYDEDIQDQSETDAVELIDTVNPSSEYDYTDSTNDEIRYNNHRVLYTVEYDGTTYIVYEYLTWFEGYNYECHIYTLKGGSFAEVSNVFVPGIGSDGTEIIYSTKLPDGMNIDNSDLDYSAFESGDYIKENFQVTVSIFFILLRAENLILSTAHILKV